MLKMAGNICGVSIKISLVMATDTELWHKQIIHFTDLATMGKHADESEPQGFVVTCTNRYH